MKTLGLVIKVDYEDSLPCYKILTMDDYPETPIVYGEWFDNQSFDYQIKLIRPLTDYTTCKHGYFSDVSEILELLPQDIREGIIGGRGRKVLSFKP